MSIALVSTYLDQRRRKKSGYYPLKLRVYEPQSKKSKFYPYQKLTFKRLESKEAIAAIKRGFKNQDQLKDILSGKDKSPVARHIRSHIASIESEIETILASMDHFTYEKLESVLYSEKYDLNDLSGYYQRHIKSLREISKYGNASNYETSLKSLVEANRAINGSDQLTFNTITPAWLERYESYMLNTLSRSESTISMYLRALRAILNKAINERLIPQSSYPFGSSAKGMYTIPSSTRVNKALTADQLKLLFQSSPETMEQEKAKDFWFFSYFANGMNVKDILLLKVRDIKHDGIEYKRAKTRSTGKKAVKTIFITRKDYLWSILDKHGNLNGNPNDFVFPILSHSQSLEEQHKKIKNFTRFINQNFNKYANNCGLKHRISTYWARHSFTVNMMNKGANLVEVSNALSHSDIDTTQNYLQGIKSHLNKEVMDKYSDFLS